MVLRHIGRIATIVAGLSVAAVPHATPGATLRVWKIGSPHYGNVPPTTVAGVLRQQLESRGIAVEVQGFPARGFAQVFSDSVRRNVAPDVLVFDNFGVVEGMVVGAERFDGIAEAPEVQRNLVRVTGAYDGLLGPERGWVYLFSGSANHDAARAFALLTPQCGLKAPARVDLAALGSTLATAYLEGDTATLQTHADPDRLTRLPLIQNPVDVDGAVGCTVWANSRLAFVQVLASYQGRDAIGRLPLMLVMRKISAEWQLLVASRDPVTNGVFTRQLDELTVLLDNESEATVPPGATELRPSDRIFPVARMGERFGAFSWQSSRADDVVAEIGEFTYKDDARLFLTRPSRPGGRVEISTGQLWTARDWWNWRIWSITRAGNVASSEVRSFYH